LDKVKSKKKISFHHGDYNFFKGNKIRNFQLISKFDRIVCVSYSTSKSILRYHPSLSERIFVLYNFVNKELTYFKNQSITNSLYCSNFFNIITVSRLSPEKGLLRAFEVINKLIKEGLKIKWHIIGNGPQYKKIIKYIHRNKLQKYVILYGEIQNPFTYFIGANLFLLPSIHEAAPMVYEEAKLMNIPLLSTKTLSAVEMNDLLSFGYVCENSFDGLTESLRFLVKDNLSTLNLNKSNLNENYKLNQFIELLKD
jgi:glycosyltransferase involved in cell wall biosynthesis